MQPIVKLVIAGTAMFATLGLIAGLSGMYSLNIKAKTVGHGQHGTARWATKGEIKKTYTHVPVSYTHLDVYKRQVSYSLRREDAQRLGYDTAARWRDLLRSQAVTLAEGLQIPPTHLKWYAAFHLSLIHIYRPQVRRLRRGRSVVSKPWSVAPRQRHPRAGDAYFLPVVRQRFQHRRPCGHRGTGGKWQGLHH